MAPSRKATVIFHGFRLTRRHYVMRQVYEKAEVKKKKHDHVVLKDDLLTTELDSTAVL